MSNLTTLIDLQRGSFLDEASPSNLATSLTIPGMKDGKPFCVAAIWDTWRDPQTGADIRPLL
ncbi:MAG TPA: hypothetical protein VFT69_19690, partial [Pseudolabrys sp.]|nr:hypothetical protein [Pseudolabrys sp.]